MDLRLGHATHSIHFAVGMGFVSGIDLTDSVSHWNPVKEQSVLSATGTGENQPVLEPV